MAKQAVVALGSGTLLRSGQRGSAGEQWENLRPTARALAGIMADGYRLLLTHGNGPQVGNIVLQNEEARSLVPAMPLDICGAQSQGQIGFLVATTLTNALAERGISSPVVALLTRVLVDANDPAFRQPQKAIGPIYTDGKAMELRHKGYWLRKQEWGWRQVVPSPEPIAICEGAVLKTLLEQGATVVAGGGGGVPVVRDPSGQLVGVSAVVEKDLVAAQLAREVGAELLTDVPRVVLGYGTEAPEALPEIRVAEGRRLLAEGHFPRRNMGIKLEAALRFVQAGGGQAIITNLEQLPLALAGRGGTRVVP